MVGPKTLAAMRLAMPQEKRTHGLDVSKWQGIIDWPRVKSQTEYPAEFVFIKCTQGAGYKDRRFETNWRGAGSVDIPRGVYHWYTWRDKGPQAPDAQAKQTLGALEGVGGFECNDLCVAVELEEDPRAGVRKEEPFSAAKAAQYIEAVEHYVHRVEAATGRMVTVYTNFPSFWRGVLRDVQSQVLIGKPFWVAHYPPLRSLRISGGWSDWTIWQYDSKRRVDGINANTCDTNWLGGSVDDFRRSIMHGD